MADEGQIPELIERLSSDSYLRDEFRQSPVEVVEQAGIELTDEQRELLEGEDWSSVSDDELIERLGQRGTGAFL